MFGKGQRLGFKIFKNLLKLWGVLNLWGVIIVSHVKVIVLFIEYDNLAMLLWDLQHAFLIFVKLKVVQVNRMLILGFILSFILRTRRLILGYSLSLILRNRKSNFYLFLCMNHLRKVGGHDFLVNLEKCELVP